jgi:hypothetical protein
MLKSVSKLIYVLSVAAVTLMAADPSLGRWKINLDKSQYSPGPAPKSGVTTITKDGDWIIVKNDGVDAEGKKVAGRIRLKRDGKEHPYETPDGHRGTISSKIIDDNHYETVTKLDGGGETTMSVVISPDGKTRTQTVKGVNAKGKTVNNVVVLERQ